MKEYAIHIERQPDGWWIWYVTLDGRSRGRGFRMTRWGAERAARRQIRADKEGPQVFRVRV